MKQNGLFIALEGIDGSGKSTQLARLAAYLREAGLDCRETREPTASAIGTMIRQILTGELAVDNRVIACLFAADRLDHLVNERDGLLKVLEAGTAVVTDRYYFSSYAYHACDMDMERVIQMNDVSASLLRPTLTVFLDVPVETALERITRGRDHVELFEKADRLTAVRENYLRAFERLRGVERVAIIDADADEDTVAARIREAVSPLL